MARCSPPWAVAPIRGSRCRPIRPKPREPNRSEARPTELFRRIAGSSRRWSKVASARRSCGGQRGRTAGSANEAHVRRLEGGLVRDHARSAQHKGVLAELRHALQPRALVELKPVLAQGSGLVRRGPLRDHRRRRCACPSTARAAAQSARRRALRERLLRRHGFRWTRGAGLVRAFSGRARSTSTTAFCRNCGWNCRACRWAAMSPWCRPVRSTASLPSRPPHTSSWNSKAPWFDITDESRSSRRCPPRR